MSKYIVDNKERWEKSWKKALGYLEKSGVNPDFAERIRIALDAGFDKVMDAVEIEHDRLFAGMSDEEARAKIEAIDPRLTDTTILWHMDTCADIKTNRFGYKGITEYIRQQIANAIANGERYAEQLYSGSYDVTVYYNPKDRHLEYAEEYRRLGNGHYYLGLDEKHVLYMEDD